MTKQELNRQVNAILAKRRSDAEEDQRARYRDAMENPLFKQAELAKRRCETALAQALATHQDGQSIVAELRKRTQELTRIAEANRYDLERHPFCPICQDKGYVGTKECACRKKLYDELLRQSCGMANLPVFTFDDNRFDTIEQPQSPNMRKLYALMRRFCDHFGATPIRTVFLSGAVGVGKSCVACACAWELMKQGYGVLYLSAFDFGNVLLARHLGKRDGRDILFDDVLDADFLVVDDLGTEPIYRNVTLEYLFSILDSRITAGKKTMIVSNLNAEQFITRYGERTFSRLVNKRYAIAPCYIQGNDLRLTPRN